MSAAQPNAAPPNAEPSSADQPVVVRPIERKSAAVAPPNAAPFGSHFKTLSTIHEELDEPFKSAGRIVERLSAWIFIEIMGRKLSFMTMVKIRSRILLMNYVSQICPVALRDHLVIKFKWTSTTIGLFVCKNAAVREYRLIYEYLREMQNRVEQTALFKTAIKDFLGGGTPSRVAVAEFSMRLPQLIIDCQQLIEYPDDKFSVEELAVIAPFVTDVKNPCTCSESESESDSDAAFDSESDSDAASDTYTDVDPDSVHLGGQNST